MARRLFCEISPATYAVSKWKEQWKRRLKQFFSRKRFAAHFSQEPLPVLLYAHKSLIRRKLGDVDMRLQENKAVNLSLAAPRLSGIIIAPGETFSLWRLVGKPSAKRGFLKGLAIANSHTTADVGGGMCQLSNLLHWMVLHSPLQVTEYHHHNDFDLFPDFGRTVPFGTGTSILYNYLDYQARNSLAFPVQLLVWTTDTHLCGELRAARDIGFTYHIAETESYFTRENNEVFRNNTVVRNTVDKRTGDIVAAEIVCVSHAKVMYDKSYINPELIRSLTPTS